jgi:hypothetical protein
MQSQLENESPGRTSMILAGSKLGGRDVGMSVPDPIAINAMLASFVLLAIVSSCERAALGAVRTKRSGFVTICEMPNKLVGKCCYSDITSRFQKRDSLPRASGKREPGELPMKALLTVIAGKL